jgi:hypothetical protein
LRSEHDSRDGHSAKREKQSWMDVEACEEICVSWDQGMSRRDGVSRGDDPLTESCQREVDVGVMPKDHEVVSSRSCRVEAEGLERRDRKVWRVQEPAEISPWEAKLQPLQASRVWSEACYRSLETEVGILLQLEYGDPNGEWEISRALQPEGDDCREGANLLVRPRTNGALHTSGSTKKLVSGRQCWKIRRKMSLGRRWAAA